jgi:galactonate dehydratase
VCTPTKAPPGWARPTSAPQPQRPTCTSASPLSCWERTPAASTTSTAACGPTSASPARAEIRALSAVDVALWDIAGKAKGQPVCDLFGGRARAEIPVYNTCAGPSYVSKTSAVRPENFGLGTGERRRFEDLEAFLHRADELAADLMETGIFSMKIWPFDLAAGAAEGVEISVADLKAALGPFEKVRAAHGHRMRLKAELHGLWNLAPAKMICAALEPLGMDWIEDPIRMDRVWELPALAAHTRAPLAGGETLGGMGQVGRRHHVRPPLRDTGGRARFADRVP